MSIWMAMARIDERVIGDLTKDKDYGARLEPPAGAPDARVSTTQDGIVLFDLKQDWLWLHMMFSGRQAEDGAGPGDPSHFLFEPVSDWLEVGFGPPVVHNPPSTAAVATFLEGQSHAQRERNYRAAMAVYLERRGKPADNFSAFKTEWRAFVDEVIAFVSAAAAARQWLIVTAT